MSWSGADLTIILRQRTLCFGGMEDSCSRKVTPCRVHLCSTIQPDVGKAAILVLYPVVESIKSSDQLPKTNIWLLKTKAAISH